MTRSLVYSRLAFGAALAASAIAVFSVGVTLCGGAVQQIFIGGEDIQTAGQWRLLGLAFLIAGATTFVVAYRTANPALDQMNRKEHMT